MSITFSVLRSRVQLKVNELDARRATAGVIIIDNAMADAFIAIAARLPAPWVITESAGSIAANADTFTLPTASAEEYAGGLRIRLRSDGSFLLKSTIDEIDRFRANDPSTVGTTRPQRFAVWEESDQDVICRCWPRSKDTETYDLFARMSVTDPRDAASMDAATIPFSRYGITALVYQAAALVIDGQTDEDLAVRRINRNVTRGWMRNAEILIAKEAERRHSISSVGRSVRVHS